jgi:hypothetical protein
MGVRVSDESRGASGAQQLLVYRYKALFKVYLRVSNTASGRA